MHFFIDYLNLPIQNSLDSFGPDTTNPTTIYNVSSKFQLRTQAKACATQRGLIIVQQSEEDESLVNVILKPITELTIPFQEVAYYIYRGILKDSFFDGSNITSQNYNTNTDIVTRIYNADPKTSLYSASILGFDDTISADENIETLYNSSTSILRAFLVEEGEWFGTFTTSHKISFEIVTEPEKVNITIGYLRKGKAIIDVTGITGFDLISKKEEILAFIDPAAFFGLHYKVGVNIPSSSSLDTTITLKGDVMYTNLIAPFATKNRVYLDIRSEYGFSYNFYQNYLNGNGNNIKLGFSDAIITEKNYATNGWPIIFVDAPQSSSTKENHLKLSLRIDDNLKPVLFFENSEISENSQDNFVGEKDLLIEHNTDWTKEVSFKFPNTGENAVKDNVAYYLQMYYFRQEYNPDSPPTVLRKALNINNFFAPIDIPYLGDENNPFKQSEHTKPIFMFGEHLPEELNPGPTPSYLDKLSKSNSFSQVVGSGAYYDNNLVTFYSKVRVPKEQSGRSLVAAPIEGFGLKLDGKFAKQSFLANDLGVNAIEIQEVIGTDTFQQVNLLNVFANKNVQHKLEDIALLGITKSELQSLKSVSGLSSKHPRQIIFQPVYPSPTDKDGIPYNKYTLQVLGLDSNGNSTKVSPDPAIYTYSAKDALVWVSKAFTDSLPYTKLVQEPIIENGIKYEKLSFDNSSYTNYQIIGESEDKKDILDMKYGTDGDITKIIPEARYLLESESAMVSMMVQLLSFGTHLDLGMKWAAMGFVFNFINNTNKTDPYSSSIVNNKVAQSSRFINYIKTFGKDLEDQLRSLNGNINHLIPPIFYSTKSNKRPKFDQKYYDYLNGLAILIDDTERTKIMLEPGSYNYEPTTGVWDATIVVEILDHFGLDNADISKNQTKYGVFPVGLGFASWWMLQHMKGYAPFITKVNVRCKLSGII